MNIYKKYILPKLINSAMKRADMEKHRPDIASKVSGTVLEIGLGSGLNLPYYESVAKLYALEPSQELYELARERIRAVSFPVEHIHVSAEMIPLPDNAVDFVVSTWSLCSIPRPEVALKEVFRVLKPGGRFVFIEHGKSLWRFAARLQKLLTPISKFFTGGCHMDREIDRLISGAGLEIQMIDKFQQKSRLLTFMYKGVAVAVKHK